MNEVIHLLRDQNQTLQQQNEMILQLVKSDNTSEQRIKAQIEQVLDEQKEKDEIQNNLIIFNVSESNSENEEEDIQVVKDIITSIEPSFNADCLRENVTRLGRRKPDAKLARPVKVILPSLKLKTKILRGSKKLKESLKYNKVILTHALKWIL